MAEMWKPKDPTLLRSWLDAVLFEASDKLNEWERKFITDLEDRMDRNQRLSQLQEEKLEQIYARYTA